MSVDLRGATVLVTGASGGLGGVIADALAATGASVVASGRRAEELATVAARTGGRSIVADLSVPADVERLVAEAGAVDVLVANAAIPASGPLVDYDADQICRTLQVNLQAPILLCRALVPAMVARRRGHVVVMSSLAGVAATPGTCLYNATKFGLRGFAHSLRADLHGTGVGVSVLLPGFVRDAGMFADSGIRLPRGVHTSSPAQVAAATVRAIVDDVAEVVVAPAAMRVGAYVAGLAPALAARATRALGGDRLAAALSEAQRRYR